MGINVNVDSAKLIAVLKEQIAEYHLQNAILEVALSDAHAELEQAGAREQALIEALRGKDEALRGKDEERAGEHPPPEPRRAVAQKETLVRPERRSRQPMPGVNGIS